MKATTLLAAGLSSLALLIRPAIATGYQILAFSGPAAEPFEFCTGDLIGSNENHRDSGCIRPSMPTQCLLFVNNGTTSCKVYLFFDSACLRSPHTIKEVASSRDAFIAVHDTSSYAIQCSEDGDP